MSRVAYIVSVAAAAIVAGTAAVSAADFGDPAPPFIAEPQFDWSGLYVGLNGGGGWGDEDCVSCTPGANDFSISGPFVGAQVGVNWQTSGFVLGLEADIQWSGIDGLCNGAGACGGPPQLTVQDLDYFGTVRGRLGWANGQWMPYLTAGWAYGQGTRNSSVAGGASASHSGWAAGVGVEYAMTAEWSAKLEYQYIDLGNAVYVLPGGGPDPTVGLNIHTVRFGINRHF